MPSATEPDARPPRDRAAHRRSFHSKPSAFKLTDSDYQTFTLRSGVYSLGPWGASSLEEFSSSSFTLGLIANSGYSVHLTSGLFASSLSADYGTVVLSGVKLRVGGSVTPRAAD